MRQHNPLAPSKTKDTEMLNLARLADTQSASTMAREAIARWCGKPYRHTSLPSDIARVSPQARWLAQTQADLTRWRAEGGFLQADEQSLDDLPPLPGPVMFQLRSVSRNGATTHSDSVCIE